MVHNPANILTGLRVVLIPIYLFLLWSDNFGGALTLFVIAGLTDMIDGTVARKCGQPSKFGARLDPIADKLLVETAFCSLWMMGVLPLWFFVIALARDIMIICGIFYLEWRKIEFAYDPSWTSKLATLFQLAFAGLGIVFVGNLGMSWPWPWLWPLAIIVTSMFIIASGYIYVHRGIHILHENSHKDENKNLSSSETK